MNERVIERSLDVADAEEVFRILSCLGRRWALENLLILLVLGSLLSSVGQITASSTILKKAPFQ